MAKLTIITSTYPKNMSKEYKLDSEGKLTKTTSANLSSGTYQVHDLPDLQSMADLLEGLNTNQVLVFGTPEYDSGVLTTKEKLKETADPSVISRSNDYLEFSPSAGWMFLDYDPKSKRAYTMEELKNLLELAIPDVFRAGAVMYPSSSSHIINTETKEDLTKNRGIHVYIPVVSASDIPRTGKALQDKLWSGGHGYIEISKSGAMLERTVLDPSVAQDAKVDFAAGAICHAPLTQERGKPWIIEPTSKDELLDTSKYVKSVRDQKTVNDIKQQKKDALEDQANDIKKAHVKERALREAKEETKQDHPDSAAIERCYDRILAAIDGKPLEESFILHVQFGKEFKPTTVKTILKDPARYNGLLCLDPIEPSYENDKVVGKIYSTEDKAYVNSFAHGGRKFPFKMKGQFTLSVDPKNFMATSRALIELIKEGSDFGFMYYEGDFYHRTGAHYEPVTKEHNSAFVRTYLEHARTVRGNNQVKPDNNMIANVMSCLQANALLEKLKDSPPPPFMMEKKDICQGLNTIFAPKRDKYGRIEHGRYIALQNGLYDLKTKTLQPHTDAYFCTSISPFEYDENAKCPLFTDTVNDWFDGDKETVDLYFMMLGYLLTDDTSAHKIFGLYGPPRGGKGVTQSVIQALVGSSGIFSTDLEALGTTHGLQGSIHKKVLLFADVKDSFTGRGSVGEKLLKISAADLDSIPRKYKDAYEGRHTARVVMFGNSPPAIPESSSALFNRFVIMSFTKSYLGREDATLTDRILEELPGIFNRAMEGYVEYQEGAKFKNPHASAEHVLQVRDAINPIPSFVEECCEVGSDFSVDNKLLYASYKNFMEESGRKPASLQSFCTRLKAYDVRYSSKRVRRGDYDGRVIQYLKLKNQHDNISLDNGCEFEVQSLPNSTVLAGKTIANGGE